MMKNWMKTGKLGGLNAGQLGGRAAGLLKTRHTVSHENPFKIPMFQVGSVAGADLEF
jgi:hypothetical protein